MEDVLDGYTREQDEKRPLVCIDESPRQLIGEKRTPLPAEPGKLARFDTEYMRNGTCDSFTFAALLEGWWRAELPERRTRADWTEQIRRPADGDFPYAETIVLVMDNLNTPTAASLYEGFPPEEAKRIKDKLEFQYTSKHGSWLNMAKLDLSVLNRQGLPRWIPRIDGMRKEAAAWNLKRNQEVCTINRQFSTADARIKLKRLYLKFESCPTTSLPNTTMN
jgi:hypothetical protein